MRTLTTWSRYAARAGGLGMTALAAAAASLVLACRGDTPQATAVSDDLRRDLELASTATVALPHAGERTRFVSSVERGPDPAPRAPSPDRTRAREATRARARKAPAPATGIAAGNAAARSESAVQEAPAPAGVSEPVQTAAADAAAPAPTQAQAPEPAPEIHEPGMGAGSGPNAGGEAQGGGGGRGSEGRGRGIGDIFGGVIGVVIRGGMVDGDHCERDRPGRRGGYPGANIPVLGGGYGGLPMPMPSPRQRMGWPRVRM